MQKSTFSGLQRCRRLYGFIFIRLAAVASQICEIPLNSLKIRTYTVHAYPRSSIWCQSKVHMQLSISH